MGGRYRAYPVYKESGVDWLGKVPESWTLCPLKHMADIKNGHDYKSVETEEGYPVIGSGGQFTYASHFLYARESVLLGRKGTIDKPLYIDEPFWTVDTMYYTEIAEGIPPKYLYYLALTIQFNRYSTSTALPSMTKEHLGNYLFATPSIQYDKAQIANFLDHETAKIDTLIEKQQQLIALLKEKRQAVISHAVTKGLNPNAPMKDSGVEWLGEVPAHWVVSRFKYHTKLFEQGWSPQCDSREASSDEYGVLKVGCVNNGIFSHNENKALPKDLKPRTQYIVRKFDLLISRANTRELVGSAAVVDRDYSRLILCDKLYRVRFQDTTNTQLIAYFLALPVVRQQIELGATGASHSMQNIGQSSIKELHILLPPLQEAESLIAGIKKKIAIFEQVMNKATDQISLLQERRTALISAAVTGKIDVRNWQPPTDTKNIPDSP
jgi:type I restriction enzyme S subunit